MTDAFLGRMRNPQEPAISVFEIIPDDNVDLTHVTTAINVATPGTVRITAADGTVGDVSLVPGHVFPVRARRVWLSGTTATGISGLT